MYIEIERGQAAYAEKPEHISERQGAEKAILPKKASVDQKEASSKQVDSNKDKQELVWPEKEVFIEKKNHYLRKSLRN